MIDFNDLPEDFKAAGEKMYRRIFELPIENFLPLITKIGVIPEKIEHDSKEEKLYTKVSEIFLARCFRELGLKSTLYSTRSNTADIFVESRYHNYSLVADAKAFRLSRTAKNQKDFKIESLNAWRHDNDYAVLCCPYFQYPRKRSAIYKQALDCNIILFSWEYFRFLIENGIREEPDNNLSTLWNFNSIRAKRIIFDDADKCFLNEQNEFLTEFVDLPLENLNKAFDVFKNEMILRGALEIEFWKGRIAEIKNYSRKEAIKELLRSLKLTEKIKTIQKFIDGLQ